MADQIENKNHSMRLIVDFIQVFINSISNHTNSNNYEFNTQTVDALFHGNVRNRCL